MKISDLIEELKKLEDAHGDLFVELDSGTVVSGVDVVYSDTDNNSATAIVVK